VTLAQTQLSFGVDLRSHAAGLMDRSSATHGDVQIARRHIANITDGRCSFELANARRFIGFRSVEKLLGMSRIQILQWNSDTECQTSTERPSDQHLVFHLVLDGGFEVAQGSRRARIASDQMLIVSHPGTVVRHWRGTCDLLNLVVPRNSLQQCLQRDFGLGGAEQVEFEPLAVLDMADIPAAIGLLETIVADLNSGTSVFAQRPIAAHAERLLMLLLLKTTPHRHRSALDHSAAARIAPFYVRRAESHMQQHLASPLTIEELAAAAGVSVRTLYYGFGEFRNASPRRYLKQLRLAKARELLQAPLDRELKIGIIAGAVGYASASQFSRDYRMQFGETPAATLRSQR
jgi:AraC-like DNA-binding protein